MDTRSDQKYNSEPQKTIKLSKSFIFSFENMNKTNILKRDSFLFYQSHSNYIKTKLNLMKINKKKHLIHFLHNKFKNFKQISSLI